MLARQGLCSLRSVPKTSLSSVVHRMTVSRLPSHATALRKMSTSAESPPPPTPAQVDAYLESKLVPRGQWADEPGLHESRAKALLEGMPDIAVSAMQGHFLTVLARGMGATKILEIGTLWGYSTYFLTRALPPHGQIDTLEVNPLHAQVAQETFLNCDLYPFPSIHLGPALSTLKKLAPPGAQDGLQGDEVGYDLVFIDADKASVKEYFLQSLRLTRKGGVIIVDNAVRRGRILPEVEADEQDKGLRRLYDWVEQDAGKTVLVSGIQTVGAKSWDGFAIATKL